MGEFRFRKFAVEHDVCGMKVGTDGILLGAWCNTQNVHRVLDVGCGCGLIALMVAQRCDQAMIEAVDIDETAVKVCGRNFNKSEWHNRLNVQKLNFEDHSNTLTSKYDLIVSNPPFYSEGTKCPNEERNKARHTTSLPFEKLIRNAANLLTATGTFCVIIPTSEYERFATIAKQNGLYEKHTTMVKTTARKTPKRVLMELTLTECAKETDVMVIYDENNKKTAEFSRLTQEFYL